MNFQEAKALAQEDANRTSMIYAVVGNPQGRGNRFSIMTAQSAKVNGIHVWEIVEPQRAASETTEDSQQ
jgi:hypothetical protein